MNKNLKKNIISWIIIIGLVLAFSTTFDRTFSNKTELAFSDFLDKANTGDVKEIEIKGNEISGNLKDGSAFYTLSTEYPDLIKDLRTKNVSIKVIPVLSKSEKIFGALLGWLPFILLIGLWIFFMKGASGGAGGAFKFAKSRAKLLLMKGKITFKDVAGIDEAKDELIELVDFLKDPEKYTKLGAKIPRGCLLVGEPGTGKTLLARAIAGEANVPFFFISGSDFVEMFVGVGASRVRDMFEEAKKSAPCLIFIDEIDAVGRHRGIGIGGGNDEREQTLNQLLVEMDGFEGNQGVIVIAATNRPDVLDKALMRPGRFDRQIMVSLPDCKGRKEILDVHAKKVQLASDVDLGVVARSTPGFSGADLANLINESALIAAKRGRKMVTMQEVEEATDKIIMGLEKKNKVMKEEDRKLTAYHEAGHTLVAMNCKHVDPLHKVTIISRGMAGGVTSFLPEDDKNYETKIEMLEAIAVSFGGRAAEELIFGQDKVTGGASADIKHATKIAERMVTVYGFDDKLGPVNYERKRNGGESYQLEGSSNETLNLIDSEIKNIILQQKKIAENILKNRKEDLVKIAEALMKYETLNKEQVENILSGKDLNIGNETDNPNYNNTNFSIFNSKFIENVENLEVKSDKSRDDKKNNSEKKIDVKEIDVKENSKTTKLLKSKVKKKVTKVINKK